MSASADKGRGDHDTFPKLLLRNADIFADRPGMREKEFGIWQTWNWAQILEEVRDFSIGIQTLGISKGKKVAILGGNRPRLYWSILGCQSLNAIPIPIYSDSVADEIAYILEHAEVNFAIVEDQEQVDKILSIAERVPSIERIIYDDARGLRDYDHTTLHSFEWVQEQGRTIQKENADTSKAWVAGINETDPEDLSVMLYTSGTTGKPKGVMLSHTNTVVSSKNGNLFDNIDETEDVIAYLPLAWVGDHVFCFGQSLAAGFCLNCPESPETVIDDRREIGPTYFFAPPRVFENLLTLIMVRMEDAGAVKRWLFKTFLGVAKKSGEKLLNGEEVSFFSKMMYGLGEILVYGPLKNRMGLSRLKVGYTAGEAIGPEIFSFYRSLGLNLKQLYGQTEASVYITMQPDGEIKPDTVGTPAPDVEIKIDDSGEVLFRSPGVFVGYYKNDDATAETKTDDGWVHSGDAGLIDETGHLKIIDRAKDVGRLSHGGLFAPKYIENKLKFYPNIKEAVAFGDERDFVAVMINIDLVAVGNWAERNNVNYASYQELAANPDVYGMIRENVEAVNKDLAHEKGMEGAQIIRFLILHKELDADDGELTRTQKVRRRFIAERYGELIDALYDGSPSRYVKTEVTFEDGRRGTIEADVKIVNVTPVDAPNMYKEAAE